MNATLRYEVYQQGRRLHVGQFAGALELGRQQSPEESLFQVSQAADAQRVAVAPLDASMVSRRHVLLEPTAEDRVRVTNLTAKNAIRLRDGTIAPGDGRELFAPCRVSVGEIEIRVAPLASTASDLHSLMQPAAAPGSARLAAGASAVRLPALDQHDSESVVAWLQTVTTVLQSAASSEDFFQRAASAVVDLVGLDSGQVLLCREDRWEPVAQKAASSAAARPGDWQPSRRVLEAMRDERKTTWRQGSEVSAVQGSLAQVEAVVVSPILDRGGAVIGALYGDRLLGTRSPLGARITQPDAMLMETLASGVAAGLARLEQERAAIGARIQFEQFFSAELAEQLSLHPDLLEGRDTEVTVLFADIRGFSRIAERLGPAGTMDWINDVLGAASECVIRHGGVLVDYVGDELLAMWGAPTAQPDHAERACRAAVDMWQALPAVNERWQGRLGEATRLGIGVNTGPARVGNTGTQRKFKYGPLGNTVNLCSRVQGATKYLKSGIVVTAATQARLDDSFATRRLCQVRVVNIAEPVALYELCPQADAAWQEIRARYEEALREFEQQRFGKTTTIAGEILEAHPDDGPSIVLLSRAATLLAEQLGGRAGEF
ncbi:MAG TPA: adenylate/guanylate cyclase domain-containing protein, partial [Pirellulales bacterium]|nr:adenylate/guanylate cyclase domain-containing protein [Pirellulales bacterium]